MGQEEWCGGYAWDSRVRQPEGGEGVHMGNA